MTPEEAAQGRLISAIRSAFNPPCIVDDNTPLWECPCRECWALEMDLCDPDNDRDSQRVTYKEWREERSS